MELNYRTHIPKFTVTASIPFTTTSTLDLDQTIAELSTNTVYRDTLSATLSGLKAWGDQINAWEIVVGWPDYTITTQSELFQNTNRLDYDVTEIPDEPVTLKLHENNRFFEHPFFVDKEDLLKLINLIKTAFFILSNLCFLEIVSIFVILDIFSQQFGGNRDLPVITK